MTAKAVRSCSAVDVRFIMQNDIQQRAVDFQVSVALWLHNKQTLVPERRDVAIVTSPASATNAIIKASFPKYGSNNDDFFAD
jgi:hypothetical protein